MPLQTSSRSSVGPLFNTQVRRSKHSKDMYKRQSKTSPEKKEQLDKLIKENLKLKADNMLSLQEISQLKSEYYQQKRAIKNIREEIHYFLNYDYSKDTLLNDKVNKLNDQLEVLRNRVSNENQYLKKCVESCEKEERAINKLKKLNEKLRDDHNLGSSTSTLTTDCDWRTCTEYDSV